MWKKVQYKRNFKKSSNRPSSKELQVPRIWQIIQTNSDLKKHSTVHILSKNVECPGCGKFFKSTRNLQQHLKGHKRSYKCETCNETFKSFSDLRSHKVTHSNKAPSKCPECRKLFGERRYLCTKALENTQWK